jgi:divalent metal cation (Fe/Co/Zn/Cd) transporter
MIVERINTEHAAALLRRGVLLEYVTLGWNVVGTVIVVAAAIEARSVALAGFGLDSLIEIFASTIVIWQLKGIDRDRERPALKMIGAAFFLLALYVLVQAAYVLATGIHPEPSGSGTLWLIATVISMLMLAWGKLVTGRRLGNAVLVAESRVTLIDAYLAAAVLVGLIINARLGWWWADPLASLVLVYYGIREGVEARRHAAEL